jgi:carbon monoxide dehydrogenase subunit G
MKVTGSATIAAPLPRVWAALQDPAVLARTIPGCRSLEATGPDAYRMTVSAGSCNAAHTRGRGAAMVALPVTFMPRP